MRPGTSHPKDCPCGKKYVFGRLSTENSQIVDVKRNQFICNECWLMQKPWAYLAALEESETTCSSPTLR